MKQFIPLCLLAALLCCPFTTRAEAGDPEPKWFEVNIQDANTLSTLLSAQLADDETMASVQYLRLSGTLGADDITLLKSSLTSLVEVDMLGLNITDLPERLFYSYSNEHQSLRRVVLPANLTTINNAAFSYCRNLEVVVAPATLTTIASDAFEYAESLTSFNFSDTQIQSIGTDAFSNSKITEIHFPNTLRTIGDYAFEFNTQLGTVTFPAELENLDYLGGYAFRYSALEAISLPVVNDCRAGVFQGCSSLATVTLAEGFKRISTSMFEGCTSLISIDIPRSVTKIGTKGFYNCRNLATATLHEGLKEISESAFANCTALTSITLPSTLINIYDIPFYNSGLTTITAKSYIPCYVEIGLFNSNGTQVACTLRAPRKVLSTYKTAPYWTIFTNYEALDDEADPLFPNEINTLREISIVTPTNQPAEWKPEVNLLSALDALTSYSSVENIRFEYGRLRVLGEDPLHISTLSLTAHEYFRRSYATSGESKYDSMYSQLIPRTAVTADQVNLHMYFNSVSPGYSSTWHYVAFPFDIDLADHNLNEQGHYYAIYEYDSNRRANGENGWVRIDDDARLVAGKGYIFSPSGRVNNLSTTLEDMTFHSDSSAANPVTIKGDEDVTIELTDYPSDYAQNAGWNFIGNPYLSYYDTRFIDFDGPITVRTAASTSSSSYMAYSLVDDQKILVPYEAFFVQRSVTATNVVFHKEGQQFTRVARTLDPAAAPARIAQRNPNRVLFNLTLSDGDFTDRTRVVINPEASESYEPSRDASKFRAEDAATAQICTVIGNVEYAINELPLPNNDITLRTITIPGRYTIALEQPVENYTVELIDLKTGNVTDLGIEACEYEAESTDSTQRFALRLTPGLSGVENINASMPVTDNVWYNLQGIRLNGEPSAAGIYIHNGKKVIIK